jgi:hypothetical protein
LLPTLQFEFTKTFSTPTGFINIYPADALDVGNRLDELKLD